MAWSDLKFVREQKQARDAALLGTVKPCRDWDAEIAHSPHGWVADRRYACPGYRPLNGPEQPWDFNWPQQYPGPLFWRSSS